MNTNRIHIALVWVTLTFQAWKSFGMGLDCHTHRIVSMASLPKSVAWVGLGAKWRGHHVETCWLWGIIWWLYTNEFYWRNITSWRPVVSSQHCSFIINYSPNGECMKFYFLNQDPALFLKTIDIVIIHFLFSPRSIRTATVLWMPLF